MAVLQALRDLLDFRHAFYQLILNPVDTCKAYLPPFNAYGLFGGDTFLPEKNIPDLSGKVILVTGGQSSLHSILYTLLTCHLQVMEDLG